MSITYKQYGTSALIFEGGKAICTATFEDGWWRAQFWRSNNETRLRAGGGGCPDHHQAGTLDLLCKEMIFRSHGCWMTGPVKVWGDQARYGYQCYGNVAVITENGRGICVAEKKGDSWWVAKTYPPIGRGAGGLHGPGAGYLSDVSLERMIAQLNGLLPIDSGEEH